MNLPIITYRSRITGLFPALFLAALFGLTSACNKAIDEPLHSAGNSMRDSTTNIRTILAGSPFHLFSQAYNRLTPDSSFAFYTIFAPTDSVMQAAGLTSAVIDALTRDSLYKIVAYQIAMGNYSDSLLATFQLPLRVPAMREDVTFVQQQYSPGMIGQTFRQSLYLLKKDVVYVNGIPVNHGEPPLKARNGWIYPVNHLFTAPVSDAWSILKSRPELSMYVAANRIVDSFYIASNAYSFTNDTVSFAKPYYESDVANPPPFFTIFAPTNDAFAQAGFNTIDDIRQYVKKVVPGYSYINTGTHYYNVYTYVNMDSVLKLHYVNNTTNSLFYTDLLNGPAINKTPFNTNPWLTVSFVTNPTVAPYYPQFSGQGGTVNIRWSRDPSLPPAVLPPGGTSFQALNGNIYEIGQLFYPHN